MFDQVAPAADLLDYGVIPLERNHWLLQSHFWGLRTTFVE